MGNMIDFQSGLYSDMLNEIDMKYKFNNINKHLIYYPHMGVIDATVNGGNVIMLPFHMFVLEQFTESDTKLTRDDIMIRLKNLNYEDTIKYKIIDSLVIGNILIENDNYYYANNVINDVNVIDIFYNINNKQNITKNIMIELAHERIDIVKANINHFLKHKEYIEEELYKMVCNNIKIFNVTKELFTRAITIMTDNEYIKMDGANVVKMIW
jgi:hypothetical protein